MMSTAALRAILQRLDDTDAWLLFSVRLLKAPITPGPNITPADLDPIEADYTGYVRAAPLAVGVAWDDEQNNAVLSLAGVHFQPTGSAATNAIYGYWVTSLSYSNLRCSPSA